MPNVAPAVAKAVVDAYYPEALQEAENARNRATCLAEAQQVEAAAEAERIRTVESARSEAEQESVKAREALRGEVAALAVKGAEQILRKEVNAGVHSDLLNRLKTEL